MSAALPGEVWRGDVLLSRGDAPRLCCIAPIGGALRGLVHTPLRVPGPPWSYPSQRGERAIFEAWAMALAKALTEACDGWEEANGYVDAYHRRKWRLDERLAEARSVIPARRGRASS